uniref:Ycf66 n=2 Tax=Pavlovaceae TaxID=418969 RepID=M1JFK4_DIALT|nr:Ycf66 [Diacronema lutheri]YP_009863775.1 Ycf66 [Pavlova sp. NIVA-4/92]AGE93828.1 Ycf66 [Diacronema lutheri]QKE31106.1 Ycf66 [Pavlova sp. NIVA-4/92]
MINIDFGYNFILGCFVALVGIALYSIRFLNPRIAEEKDVFLSTLFFIYSGIIIIHGWRLDPILFLSQILIVILSISFFMENLSLRTRVLKQKKRELIKKKIEDNMQNLVDGNGNDDDDDDDEPIDIFKIFR